MIGILLTLLIGSGAQAGPSSIPAQAFERYSVLTPAGPAEPSPELIRSLDRLVWTQHSVIKGEYGAEQIAKKYGTTAMSLQVTNNDELYVLNPGRKMIVLNKNGQLYEVKKATETLDRIIATVHRDKAQAFKYKQLVVAVNRLPGVALLEDYELVKGQRLLLPNVTRSWDSYHFPIVGPIRISSGFGSRYHPLLKRRRMHDGLDIAKPWGTPVYPARSGTVTEAGWSEGYGQLIVIRHADGMTTRYGHLSKMYVKAGQSVQRGKTLIGRVGSTGLSTGPHLHFEVRDRNGKAVNPGAKIGRR
jgi:murein DD-endopeptidase MepM/ murein hydrolase activator NlpD